MKNVFQKNWDFYFENNGFFHSNEVEYDDDEEYFKGEVKLIEGDIDTSFSLRCG